MKGNLESSSEKASSCICSSGILYSLPNPTNNTDLGFCPSSHWMELELVDVLLLSCGIGGSTPIGPSPNGGHWRRPMHQGRVCFPPHPLHGHSGSSLGLDLISRTAAQLVTPGKPM